MKLYSTCITVLTKRETNTWGEHGNKLENVSGESRETILCIVSLWKNWVKKKKKGREQIESMESEIFFFRVFLSPRITCLDIRIKSFHSRSSRHRSLQFLFYHIHASTCVDRSFIMTRYILGKSSGWIGIHLWRE